ncbi:hypothetical protein Q7P37_000795 [Cladosporium fusiforme]
MAPSRGKAKAKNVPATAPRRSTRSRNSTATKAKETTPDVYKDMVAEAVAADPPETSDRPLKRRKVSQEPLTPNKPAQSKPAPRSTKSEVAPSTPAQETAEAFDSDVIPIDRPQQTVEYSSESEESEFAFEDVDLGQKALQSPLPGQTDDEDEIKDVAISLAPSTSTPKTVINRRKPATATEKAFRLRVHKVHFLTLLGHCMYANSRCNNATVQRLVRRLVDKRMRSYLNPKTTDTQFQRNRSFMDGLEQAKDALKAEFRITSDGMSRPHWPTDGGDTGPSSGGGPMDLADFVSAARDLEGSQDTGNQLFCAMLRAAGVEARLVCSLQTLPFANPPPKSSTPQKQKKPAIFAIAPDSDLNLSDASVSDENVSTSASIGKVPSVRRRLGQPSFTTNQKGAPPPKAKAKPIRTLSYPVYWVEAFNTAHQKWVPVDPMVTNTVGKASKIEPPASYDLNQMIYAIAFESDGVVRDVTRRYAKAFNAKTRRQRVESSGEDGAKWFTKSLRLFRRRQRLDRDQVEDAELAQKEAREGLPSNVLDFKNHPYYALERHLRRHEVLHPRREAGKVNAGTAAKPRMEPVFRRQDVLSCKSADKWYRLGREVKQGEQPLKHVPARALRRKDLDEDVHDAEAGTTGLYSIHQTQVYIPPPVQRGKITKNAFGNLDVYVPSMVPSGGMHIRHASTQQAARALNIDFADAVTGFKFQGRQGTAIVEGAVVPQEYGEAVLAIIEGLEYEAMEEASKARSLTALRLWARFMKGLRIADRVAAYGEKSTAEVVDDQQAEVMDFGGDEALSADADDPTMPTAGQYSITELTMPSKSTRKKARKAYESPVETDDGNAVPSRRSGRKRGVAIIDDEDDEQDEYMPDYEGGGGGFLPEDAEEVRETGGGFLPEDEYDGGGGFVPEDTSNAENGGGFIPAEDAGNEGGFMQDESNGDVGQSEGGFMPEGNVDDDGGGGGFIPDDADRDNMNGGGFITENEKVTERATSEDVDEDDLFGESISEKNGKTPELMTYEPTPVSDGITTARNNTTAAQMQSTDSLDASNEAQLTNAQSTPEQQPSPPEPAASKNGEALLQSDNNAPEELHGNDGDEDADSLLSHDPEDEDAEPDWLESD